MEAPGRDRQQRDVYISDHQHLVPVADPHQHDRLPQPVRQRRSGSDRGTGAARDDREYGGGGSVLQSHGQEKH